MKKQLTKFLFILLAVVCFSVSASAQKTDDEKGVRKPPVIVPDKDRQPKDDKTKDKDKDKDKKPLIFTTYVQARVGVDI